ncbi:hypothetical protein [Streptomyces barringtoniae]|uniref:hypothetical protein n=1 Tax=Streptomyces barringtoniae TaxID=2892029 RepID=UPI001E583438|nr:hypothetical protein [Streptomyces barringtoniae]MCC5479061.1 hypothetical protein [Streptomyces barringtoniae]
MGWVAQTPGSAGTLWLRDQSKVGIPNVAVNDREIAHGVLKRLAYIEQESEEKLALRIRHHLMDVAFLRAAKDYRITDTIPFEAAATVIGSTRKLLRASGTTAWREQSEIGGNYTRRGDQVLKSARMDHTLEGSFVIPVLIPLTEPTERAVPEPRSENLELFTSAPEPFERRVTRTLAQAILAVREIIVQPERSPTMRDLHDVVQRGVSREFCTALANILAEPAVGEFETRFEWAEAVPVAATMPQSVAIESDAQEKITQAAERLKRGRIDTRSTFSGDIVELRHVSGDPFGYIVVSTIRRGRRSEIRIRLPFDQYLEAVAWHRAQRVVIIEGEVTLGSGRRLAVETPISCRPIDEILLPVE